MGGYARLVRKGSGRSSSNEVQIGARLHSPLPNAKGWCYGPVVGYGIDWEVASLAIRAGGCHAAFEGPRFDGSTNELTLDLRLTKSLDLGSVSPFIGLEMGGVFFRQTFADGAAPAAHTFGGSVAGLFGLALDLGGGFDLTLDAGFSLYGFAFEDANRRASPRVAFALRPTLGLSKTW